MEQIGPIGLIKQKRFAAIQRGDSLLQSNLVQALFHHGFNHLGSSAIGLMVAADGVGHVTAGWVEQEGSSFDIRYSMQKVVEMVDCHREYQVGLTS